MGEECSVARDWSASLTFAMFNGGRKRRQTSNRSTAVPMDFEFTNRPSSSTKPAWAPHERMVHCPSPLRFVPNHFVTGGYDEGNPPPSPLPPHNVAPERPFTPTSEPYPSPTPGRHSVFLPQLGPPPSHVKSPDVVDVDMSEVSPNMPKTRRQPQEDFPSSPGQESRVMAPGDIRRAFRSRYGKGASKQRDVDADDADEESVIDENEEQSDRGGRVMRHAGPMITANNHYTLNLAPNTPTTKSDLPYTLSGSVFGRIYYYSTNFVRRYLQVFFNTSLCMVFLWLLLQFILTVQRDVQQRILEHSMGTMVSRRAPPAVLTCSRDVVQEIKACSVLHKNNFCEGNIVPHMFQPCGEWETCMNRDPSKIGRARIGAQLLAEIVNAFVENISWKTFVSIPGASRSFQDSV